MNTSSSSVSIRLSRIYIKDVSLLVILGFSTFIVNPNIPFGNTGCDSWYYHGLFFFLDIVEGFPGRYHIDRLPATVPGYIFYHLFNTNYAPYVKYLFFCFLTILPAYYCMRKEHNREVAIITSTIILFNPLFLGGLSTDFPNGPALAYAFLSLAAIIYARDACKLHETVPALICAGFFFAAALYSHFMAAAFFIFLPVYYLTDFKVTSLTFYKRIAFAALYFLFGMALCTFVFGFISAYFLGGSFYFFANHLNALFTINTSAYFRPIEEWVYASPAVAIMCVALLIATFAIYVAFSKRDLAQNNMAYIRAVLFFGLTSGFLIVSTVMGIYGLQYSKYYTWLVLPWAMVLAVFVSWAARKILPYQTPVILLVAIVLGQWSIDASAQPSLAAIVEDRIILIPIALGFAAVLFSVSPAQRFWRVLVAISLIMTVQAGLRPTSYGARAFSLPLATEKERYDMINGSIRFILSATPDQQPMFVTSLDNDDLQGVDAIARSFHYCHSQTDLSMWDAYNADLNVEAFRFYKRHQEFREGEFIVFIDINEGVVERANATLKPFGLVVRNRGQKVIEYKGKEYNLLVGVLQRN